MIGSILVIPVAIGGVIAGLNLGETGRQGGEVSAKSGAPEIKGRTPPAFHKKSPTTLSPSNMIVLNPATGAVIAANKADASAAALRAIQGAVTAQSAKATGSGQLEQIEQAQKTAESAQAAAAGAAAAAAQSGDH
jgi:hypothetical protein